MTITSIQVEEWLETNPDWFSEYFLRKIDIHMINKWLMLHGFQTVQDYIIQRRGSSQDSSGSGSPDPRTVTDSFFIDKDVRLHRSNSKKYLRQDFARGKLRGMFRTCEPVVASSVESSLERRRSSLKGMRQFLSLPPNSGSMLGLLIQSKVRLPRYTSIDDQLKRQLRMCNERDFFHEIIKDISHNLDLCTLTSRILLNISILLNASRSSLFFVEGPKGRQQLVSKVFDAYTGANCLPADLNGDNVVRIPWGEGIIGHVAETGQTINVTNAKQDVRFKSAVDQVADHETVALLCMPIFNQDSEVIGVAQVVNKNPETPVSSSGTGPSNDPATIYCFDDDDQKMLELYLTFCGMAISTAQAIESYTREYDRNKMLLEVVHDLFEEQTALDVVVKKIMQRAKTLLKCDHCLVLIMDRSDSQSSESKSWKVYDSVNMKQNGSASHCYQDIMGKNKIAEIVAKTGETVNIADAMSDPRARFAQGHDINHTQTKSILCKPIHNNSFQIIGVIQLMNKSTGTPFDENDDQVFEAFTIFCGLGLTNCLLYDELKKSSVKQTVALEVLAYHATTSQHEVQEFKKRALPDRKQWFLDSPDFNDFLLTSDQMILSSIRIFKDMGLIERFRIDYETLVRWLLTVRKNYRNIAYHNWRHAFNVGQFMFTLLQTFKLGQHLDELETLALVVASLCHDLDHRGTNNAFQEKSSSPLAQLYGTQATLEHHHFNHAVNILHSEGHNIFASMSLEEYSKVMLFIKQAIIATDISLHIQVREKFIPLVNSGLYSWEDNEQREILRSILMTSCDIATITKPWEVQRRAAALVVTEFFDQGDKEKAMLKIQPQALMDRERQEELPRLQMEWIDGVCMPLFKALNKMDPVFQKLLDRVGENRAHWQYLDELRLVNTMVKETDV